jgi:hypothetical protein
VGELPAKGSANYSRAMMRICPSCKSIQKLGTDCNICKAPLYPPYLVEIDGKLTLIVYEELENQ